MRVVVLLVVLSWSCVQTNVVTCEFGTCPPGQACDETHAKCVAPEQLSSCENKEPRSECDGIAGGVCLEGVCLASGCGNAIVEPEIGEQCEIGTDAPCAADCLSDLTCRNGIVDIETGEECDDENALAHDGCTSACRGEAVGWRSVPGFTERVASAMAYDSRRDRVVMYGGHRTFTAATYLGDTWEWDGVRWYPASPSVTPGPRESSALAFDADRGVTVMFGGLNVASPMSDTWEWDGARWTLRMPVGPLPSPRYDHALVAVPNPQGPDRIILFGGRKAGNSAYGDTWAWDGTQWTEIAMTGTLPLARYGHRMTYDPVRNVVVMFGGQNERGFTPDTWELANDTWTLKSTTGPDKRMLHVQAFDRVTSKTIVVGGELDLGATTPQRATWLWDGTAWTQAASSMNAAVDLVGATAVTEPTASRVLVLADRSDTRIWTGTQWTAAVTGTGFYPQGRRDAAVARDARRRRTYVYGGVGGGQEVVGDDLVMHDGTWFRYTDNDTVVGVRVGAGMAFDDARDQLVLFGGSSNTGTWTSPGSNIGTWTAHGSGGLSQRLYPAMAYDVARAQIILFGGLDGGITHNDTWLWNGTSWTQAQPATIPTQREHAAIAWDPIRERIVMFGGRAGALLLADTWLWNGTNWERATPSAAPSPRAGAALAWDASRKRLVLFGGGQANDVQRDDVWEWDGTTWLQLAVPAAGLKARRDHIAWTAFDGGGIVVYGGYFSSDETAIPDTHQLAWSGGAPEEVCIDGVDIDGDAQAGCADPDCWVTCTPLCSPGTTCDPQAPTCGDTLCNALVEDSRTCPADCS